MVWPSDMGKRCKNLSVMLYIHFLLVIYFTRLSITEGYIQCHRVGWLKHFEGFGQKRSWPSWDTILTCSRNEWESAIKAYWNDRLSGRYSKQEFSEWSVQAAPTNTTKLQNALFRLKQQFFKRKRDGVGQCMPTRAKSVTLDASEKGNAISVVAVSWAIITCWKESATDTWLPFCWSTDLHSVTPHRV
jgi:hypothetical protein